MTKLVGLVCLAEVAIFTGFNLFILHQASLWPEIFYGPAVSAISVLLILCGAIWVNGRRTRRLAMKCPTCGDRMVYRIIHSAGIIVCEEQYLISMRELEAEADAGRDATRHGGHCVAILPTWPREEKFARVKYCPTCTLIVVAKKDQIPSEHLPAIAKN